MNALDFALLLLMGWMALRGYMRGFVEEILSLVAWIVAIMAVRLFLAPVTDLAGIWLGASALTSILVFILFFAISFFVGRAAAKWVGNRTRASFMGPIDSVLGFGFGAVKGLMIAALAFLTFNLVYGLFAGERGERPEWMTRARSYPLLSASAETLSQIVRDRDQLEKAEDMFINPPKKKSK
ncbi:MAG: CvpA family protein [Sphingobium sp.]